jgi:hypothetical protein
MGCISLAQKTWQLGSSARVAPKVEQISFRVLLENWQFSILTRAQDRSPFHRHKAFPPVENGNHCWMLNWARVGTPNGLVVFLDGTCPSVQIHPPGLRSSTSISDRQADT